MPLPLIALLAGAAAGVAIDGDSPDEQKKNRDAVIALLRLTAQEAVEDQGGIRLLIRATIWTGNWGLPIMAGT